jgi:hypothetical protein
VQQEHHHHHHLLCLEHGEPCAKGGVVYCPSFVSEIISWYGTKREVYHSIGRCFRWTVARGIQHDGGCVVQYGANLNWVVKRHLLQILRMVL